MQSGSSFGFAFRVSVTTGLCIREREREREREISGIYDIRVILEVAAVRIWTVVEVGTVLAFVAAIESRR